MALDLFIDIAKFAVSRDLSETLSTVRDYIRRKDVHELKRLQASFAPGDRAAYEDITAATRFLLRDHFGLLEKEPKVLGSCAELIQNAEDHGSAGAMSRIDFDLTIRTGGATVTVTQDLPVPDMVQALLKLDPVNDWRQFNSKSAIGLQSLLNMSDLVTVHLPGSISAYHARLGMAESREAIPAQTPDKQPSGVFVTPTVNDAGIEIMRVEGRVDHTNSDRFLSYLTRFAKESEHDVIVDMAGLDFMTSAGLRALLLGNRDVHSAGRTLVVSNVTGVLREQFRISNFDALLKMAPTSEEAVLLLRK